MAIDTGVPRTRRALLAGGIGGLAALAAAALGRPLPVAAANGDPALLGKVNEATVQTTVVGRSGATGIRGVGWADYWETPRTGVYGYSGYEPIANIPAAPTSTGVYGYTEGTGRGVHGRTTLGRGVYGQATGGVGLYGFATTGYALRTNGRVRFDKCAGVATIASGARSVIVTPGIDLVSTSAVVATLQGDAGGSTTVKRVAIDTTANTFTIHLTADSAASVAVAWHVFG